VGSLDVRQDSAGAVSKTWMCRADAAGQLPS
jgi:hypothetical protein